MENFDEEHVCGCCSQEAVGHHKAREGFCRTSGAPVLAMGEGISGA